MPAPTIKAIKIPTGPGICFSEANIVEVQNKGLISVKDLRIGDLVRSSEEKFDRVYSFGHYQHDTRAVYYQIYLLDHRLPLEISKDHLLFIEGEAIPASNVNVGDKVNLGTGGTAKVLKIGTVLRSGAYAPFTMSGTIVVSGVTASSYVTLQQNSSVLVVDGYRTPISMHWLAHVFQSPHRLVCLMSPRHCEKESYSVEGISKWVEGPLHVSRWLLQQNGVVTIAIFVPSLIFVLIAYAAEAIFFGNVLLLLSIICLVTAVSFYTTRLRKGKKASAC